MMWIFYRFIGRRLLQNPFRLILLVSSLALATSLWMSVLSASLASVRSLESSVGLSPNEYPLSVVGSGRLTFQSLSACMVGLEGSFDLAVVKRAGGVVRTPSGDVAVRVIGLAGAGSATNIELAEHEIAVSEGLMQRLELSPGQRISIDIGSNVIDGATRVVGNDSPALGPDSVIVPLIALAGDEFDALYLRPLTSLSVPEVSAQLGEWFSSCSSSRLPLRVMSIGQRLSQGEQLLAAYRMNVGVMALVTLVVCGLLVWHAASLSLLGITRELSILRTLGASRSSAALWVVGESALVGLLGAVIGLTLGAPLTLATTELLLSTARDIYHTTLSAEGTFSASFAAKGLSLLVVTGVCALGAVGAALRAAHVAPSVGTRRESTTIRKLAATPAVMLAVASSLLVLLLIAILSVGPSVVWSYALVGACVVWSIASVPLFLIAAGRMARLFVSVLPAARLASAGVVTFARGHVLGVMGVSLAVALMTSLSIMVGSFRYTLERWVASRLQGDLYISVILEGAKGEESRMSEAVVSRIASTQGVDAVAPYYEAEAVVFGKPVKVSGADFNLQFAKGVYTLTTGSEPTAPYDRQLIVSESAARKLGLQVGSAVLLGDSEFSVRAVMQEFSTEQPLLLMDNRSFKALFPGQGADTLSLYAKPGVDLEALKEKLSEIQPGLLLVRNQQELVDYVMVMFDRTFRITESVRWIVFLIAGAGLVVSFVQHMWERRRELKTLRVLGASRTQIVSSTAFECALVCACAGPVGVLGGALLGWALVQHVNPVSFGWSLAFAPTWQPLTLTLLFSVALCVCVAVSAICVLRRFIEHAALADE